jgi:hypothetical protein
MQEPKQGERPVLPIRAALWCAIGAAFLTSGTAAHARPASGAATKLHGNNFYVNCKFSHTADDDPIVFPSQPGKSHPHTFFGNATTDAGSTLASLQAAATTCKPRADRAGYWVPTLYQDGREVRPAKGQFYYNLRGYDKMRAFPPGLKIVAGDAHAYQPQSKRIVYWDCGGSAGTRTSPSSTVPASCGAIHVRFKAKIRRCPSCPLAPTVYEADIKTYVELHVNFPDCWDGKRLDSPDHRSHMVYSRDYRCPASHPVKVPLIRANIRYPITGGHGVVLASGGQLTGHADFFNGWTKGALERLVDECFHDRPCNDLRRKA